MIIKLENALVVSKRTGTNQKGTAYGWLTVMAGNDGKNTLLTVYVNSERLDKLALFEPREFVDVDVELTGNSAGRPFLSLP